jgi:ubiquinone/menaquinone biosynthesis C-methylase UbiE
MTTAEQGQSRAARRAVEASRRRFDRWAPKYERDFASRLNATLQAECLTALELRPEDRFLDVGCGTGAAVRTAAVTAERAVGVDLAPAMIARAGELAEGLTNVEFLEAESGHLPFDDGAFTAVLCTTSFHHYPDPYAATAEMARVLAPGGRLVIGDPSSDRLVTRVADRVLRVAEPGHVRMYRTEDLAAILYRAGFARVRVRRLFSGGYGIWWAQR